MKNRIQFYHYYVLRILDPISLYTFLINKFHTKEKKNKLTNYGIQNYFQFKLPNHGKGTCEGIDTISMQWNKNKKQKQTKTKQKQREPHRKRGYHLFF